MTGPRVVDHGARPGAALGAVEGQRGRRHLDQIAGVQLALAELADAPVPQRAAEGCGTCERCGPACPTGAIVAPGTVITSASPPAAKVGLR